VIILAILSAVQAALLVVVGLIGRKMPLTGSFLTHLPLVELLIALAVLAAASMTLGLLISAMVSTTERTMPLLVVIVLFQVVLTGGIFALSGKAGIEQVAWLSPSRWGFAAAASTTNLNVIEFPAKVTPPPPATPKPASHAGSHSRKKQASHGKKHPAAKPSPTPAAASSAAPSSSSGSPALTTDPLWKHSARTWLTDVGLMLLLGLAFTLIAWWRLIRLTPGRRR
jgi:hypothetical protein